jgi:hypothetical protein
MTHSSRYDLSVINSHQKSSISVISLWLNDHLAYFNDSFLTLSSISSCHVMLSQVTIKCQNSDTILLSFLTIFVRSRIRKRGKYDRKIEILRYQCYWSMSYERSENNSLYAITRFLAYLSWVICLIQLFISLIDRCASSLEWA